MGPYFSPRRFVIFLMTFSLTLAPNAFGQREPEDEQLGMALKQAAASGELSDTEARLVWTLLTEPEPGSDKAMEREDAIVMKLEAAVKSGRLSEDDAAAKMEAVRRGGERVRFGRLDREPNLRVNDLPIFVDVFELDDDQRAMTRALLEGHRDWLHETATLHEAERRDVARALRDDMSNPEFDWARMSRAIESVSASFTRKREQSEEGLVRDLKSVLSDQQASRWPIVEREIRRERTMRDGELAGERTDLFDVVESLEITTDDVPELAAALERYAMELDQALISRNTYLDDEPNRSNEDDWLAHMTRETQLRVAVRDVNERWSESIAVMFEDETRDRFVDAYQRDAYPKIYRETPTHRAFDDAKSLDLEAETMARVEDLESRFLREMETRNNEIARLTRERDTNAPREVAKQKLQAERGSKGDSKNASRPVDPYELAQRRREESMLMYQRMLDAIVDGV